MDVNEIDSVSSVQILDRVFRDKAIFVHIIMRLLVIHHLHHFTRIKTIENGHII